VTGWLLDTNVLSVFAPGRPPVGHEITAWFEEHTNELFLSAISAAEVEAGIAKLVRAGAARRADELRTWFDRMLGAYADRVLPFDLAAARVAGQLADAAQAKGRHPGFADIAIAGIAQSRQLVILTFNARHFDPLGVETRDPLAVD
jgi:predicted nucleic acid-binding protein